MRFLFLWLSWRCSPNKVTQQHPLPQCPKPSGYLRKKYVTEFFFQLNACSLSPLLFFYSAVLPTTVIRTSPGMRTGSLSSQDRSYVPVVLCQAHGPTRMFTTQELHIWCATLLLLLLKDPTLATNFLFFLFKAVNLSNQGKGSFLVFSKIIFTPLVECTTNMITETES